MELAAEDGLCGGVSGPPTAAAVFKGEEAEAVSAREEDIFFDRFIFIIMAAAAACGR